MQSGLNVLHVGVEVVRVRLGPFGSVSRLSQAEAALPLCDRNTRSTATTLDDSVTHSATSPKRIQGRLAQPVGRDWPVTLLAT